MTLRLTVSEMADLDAYAAARGMRRSGAVRDAVSRAVATEKRRAQRSRESKQHEVRGTHEEKS